MSSHNSRQPNRRADFGRKPDRIGNGYGRPSPVSNVSPWQQNIMPLSSAEATLTLANSLINNLLHTRPAVPSLLDMPVQRSFEMGRGYDRGNSYSGRMSNQGTGYRRSGSYTNNERTNRRSNNKSEAPRKSTTPRKDPPKSSKSESEPKDEKECKEEKVDDGAAAASGAVKDDEKPQQVEKKVTKYDDIDPSLLVCHICNKTMWDGRSFENHINGKAHSIMMQKTAESYAFTADMMRQEQKIREMKRNRKSGQSMSKDFYCAMCDLYAPDGAIHRTTMGHRKLKKYLHPTCNQCHKEMPTRIELDEHRLTPEHMKSLGERSKEPARPKPEVMFISTLAAEESYIQDKRRRHNSSRHSRRADNKSEGETKTEAEESVEVKQEVVEGEGETKPEATEDGAEVKMETDVPNDDNVILDIKPEDDLSGITESQVPEYSTKRGVGPSYLTTFTCYKCELCNRLLDTEETAQVHLKTWKHFQNFAAVLNGNLKKEKPKEEEAGGQSEDGVQPENNKRTANNQCEDNDDNGANWKRRKTAAGDNVNGAANTEEDGDELKMETDDKADSDGWNEEWEKDVNEILTEISKNEQELGENKDEMEADKEETKEESSESPVGKPTQKARRGARRGARR